MKTKRQNIKDKLAAFVVPAVILILWQTAYSLELIPPFMLPSPAAVVGAFFEDFTLLMEHLRFTLSEAFAGLFLATVAAAIIAVAMDEWKAVHRYIYPVVILSQTIPTIAIAPLLVLWLGYGMLPKITLVFITCFFPLTMSILNGLRSADSDVIKLFHSMKASRWQILKEVKFKYALSGFFSGLRVSAAYSVVGAMIAEWLGGDGGLGVYMTRVRKSYEFDKMFAVIILISVISMILLKVVEIIEKRVMPYKYLNEENK